MSNEAEAPKVEGTASAGEKDVTPAVVELSPIEQQASEQGWVPKETWEEAGNDPNAWRPAKEFIDRGELYKTIHNTRRELKQTQSALTALQKHHQFVFEKAHRQALEELKREKRMALREGDVEAVEQLEERIEEVQAEHAKERDVIVQHTEASVNSPHPEFTAWTERNSWYVTDPEMQETADAIGIVFAKKNPGVDPQTVLKHVEEKVRKQFPEKFGVKRAAPSPTAPVDRTSRRAAKGDDIELDENERAIMNELVRNKVLTEAEYKAELKKVKGK